MDESKLELISEADRDSFRQLIIRCEKAHIEYKLDTEIEYISIYLQSGKVKREVPLFDKDDAISFASVEFEKYVFIQGYQAIYSCKDGVIESYIRLLRRIRIGPLLSRLLNINYDEMKKMKKEDLVFEVQHQVANENPITISISQPTNTILALTRRELDEESGLTIKIAGLKISNDDEIPMRPICSCRA